MCVCEGGNKDFFPGILGRLFFGEIFPGGGHHILGKIRIFLLEPEVSSQMICD